MVERTGLSSQRWGIGRCGGLALSNCGHGAQLDYRTTSKRSSQFGTFHSRAYFEKMLDGRFAILDQSAGGQPNHPYQDLYLLKRIDGEAAL